MTLSERIPAKVKVWLKAFGWAIAIAVVGQIAEQLGEPWKGWALLYIIPFLAGLAKGTPTSVMFPGTPTNRKEDIHKPGVIEGTRGDDDPKGRG